MEIFQLARELGEKILETEQAKKLADAKYVFDGNKEAQEKLFAYSDFRQNLQMQMETGAIDEEGMKEASAKMNEMIKELRSHEIIGPMVRAENEFNALVNQVMAILKHTITGEEEHSCNGSCSGCSGCH